MARTAIHPGEHLAEQLEALDMSAAELARKLRVPANRITEILNSQRSVTGDTALRFGHFFHTSPQFWLNLQAIYDLRIAQQKFGDAIRSLPTLPRGVREAARAIIRSRPESGNGGAGVSFEDRQDLLGHRSTRAPEPAGCRRPVPD